MKKKEQLKKILHPEEGKYHVHTSPVGTIWTSTIKKVYDYYKDKIKRKLKSYSTYYGLVQTMK